jgi:signal transduction histidine kinase
LINKWLFLNKKQNEDVLSKMKILLLAILPIMFVAIFACDESSEKEENIENVENLLQIAEELLNVNDSLALKYSLKANDVSIRQDNNLMIGKSFLLIAECKKNTNDVDSAISSIGKAIYYLQMTQEKKLLAMAFSRLAQIYMQTCKYQESYEYFSKGIDLAEKINDDDLLKLLYTNVSVVFTKIGNYEKSLEFILKAMELYDKDENYQQYILLQSNLVSLYNEYGKYHEALKTILPLSKEVLDMNDSMSIAVIFSEISDTYLELDSLEKADENIDIAYSHIMDDENKFPPILKAYILASKGNIFKHRKNYDSALYYFDIAKDIYQANRHISGVSDILSQMANIASEKGEQNIAKKLLLESTNNARSANYKRLISDNYKLLSNIYSEEGNATKALEYYKKYSNLKDTLFNQQSNNKILDLQINYETKKKQQENKSLKELNTLQRNYFIALAILLIILVIVIFSRYNTKKKSLEILTSKNEIISEQNKNLDILNKELSEANATKDKFFLILSHELLNPIKWIDNVASMLKDKYKKMSPDELEQALSALSHSSSTSSQLLDNLLTWSKIQVGRIEIVQENVNVHNIVRELEKVFRAKLHDKKIGIENNIAKDFYIHTDKQMLITVLRNLIDNAIKFSHPNSYVVIAANYEDGKAVVKVRDNGLGIKESDRKKIFDISQSFSTFGTNKEKGSGIGLILCKEYLEKSGGTLSINPEINKGTELILTFRVR